MQYRSQNGGTLLSVEEHVGGGSWRNVTSYNAQPLARDMLSATTTATAAERLLASCLTVIVGEIKPFSPTKTWFCALLSLGLCLVQSTLEILQAQ